MLLDITPLTHIHLILLLVAFVISFSWTRFLIQRSKKIVYAGIPLVATATIASLIITNEPSLSLGLIIASLLIVFIGGLDEKYKLPAYVQLIAQIGIALVLIISGWVIPYVTNPFSDGVLYLSFNTSHLLIYAPLWTLVWIVLMINAINWLDGLDGLSGGVGLSAFFVLIVISLLPATQDSRTLSLALIGLGVFGGFFLWNLPPAKAYLGTSGAWFLGVMLALTALIGGGKIATTLLVLAIPVIDTLVVVIQRIRVGQKPWIGDRKHHVHYRLLSFGLSKSKTLYILIAMSLVLGVLAVVAHTWLKLLVFIAAAMIVVAAIFRSKSVTLKT